MQCYVYKGDKRDDHFLYLPTVLEEAEVPSALLEMLGPLTLVVDFKLSKEKKLPQADPMQIIDNIKTQGFYLQTPKKDMLAEENLYFN